MSQLSCLSFSEFRRNLVHQQEDNDESSTVPFTHTHTAWTPPWFHPAPLMPVSLSHPVEVAGFGNRKVLSEGSSRRQSRGRVDSQAMCTRSLTYRLTLIEEAINGRGSDSATFCWCARLLPAWVSRLVVTLQSSVMTACSLACLFVCLFPFHQARTGVGGAFSCS